MNGEKIMNAFFAALWAETLKAYKSRVIGLSVAVAAIFPLVDGFFMLILKNPERAKEMGLIGAKAQLVAGTADWPSYFYVLAMTGIAGGILFDFLVVWVFGREFSDRTVKELLALPTPRGTIVAAKFVLLALWTQALSLWIFGLGLVIGNAVDIPGGSAHLAMVSFGIFLGASFLNFLLMPCVAYMAGLGRGYLPAMAWIFFTLATAQLLQVMGRGDWYPWTVPTLVAATAGPKGGSVGGYSVIMVLVACVAGLAATFIWWRSADQSK
jgi:ABC-2 type transport system permease protein